MKVFSYENKNGIATVGFTGTEKNFAVYADVHFIPGEAHEKLLQRAYINAKTAIDYEQEQDNHSLTTDEEGEPFTPDPPIADRIEIEPIPSVVFQEEQETESVELSATIYDQYGDEYDVTVEWSSTSGTIEGNQLTVETPSENETVTVTASAEDVSEQQEFTIYPYVEPIIENDTNAELSELKQLVNGILGAEA